MSEPEVGLLVRVARLHYEQGESQKRIAELLQLSPATVSRLIKRASDEGIVRFQIVDPRDDGDDLEPLADQLKRSLGLRVAHVIPQGKDSAATFLLVTRAAAHALARYLEPGVTIGVSGGRAVRETVAQLRGEEIAERAKGARVVQLMGGVASLASGVHASEITTELAARLDGTAFKIHGPAILDDKPAVKNLLANRMIAGTVSLFRSLDIALVGVGAMSPDSPLLKSGFITENELKRLLARGAVGDVCGRFISAAGGTCDPELDGRTLAIPLQDLGLVPLTLAVAFGEEKVAAIQAAVRAGVIHGLVTDQATASLLARSYKGD